LKKQLNELRKELCHAFLCPAVVSFYRREI